MANKQEIIKKIEGLVLVTEENKKKLTDLVNVSEHEEVLKQIEILLQEEDHTIERVVHDVVEDSMRQGDDSILGLLDQAIKKAKEDIRIASKEVEHEQRAGEEEQAQGLLQQF